MKLKVFIYTAMMCLATSCGSSFRSGVGGYERFLADIVSEDSTASIRSGLLETFIKRNIPGLDAYYPDSSCISGEGFISALGVTPQKAVEHYTKRNGKKHHKSDISCTSEALSEYTSAQTTDKGQKPDTMADRVLTDWGSTDREIADLEMADRASTDMGITGNLSCSIEFGQGSYAIAEDLGGNHLMLRRAEKCLRAHLDDPGYTIDSIVVIASSSPEGSVSYNMRLAQRRSTAVIDYIWAYIVHCCDSLDTANISNRSIVPEYIVHCCDSLDTAHRLTVTMAGGQEKRESPFHRGTIKFVVRHKAEDWETLDSLVSIDRRISFKEKIAYINAYEIGDPDIREGILQKLECYNYMKGSIYPKLRIVKINLHIHRK